jgi:hypothetical protein
MKGILYKGIILPTLNCIASCKMNRLPEGYFFLANIPGKEMDTTLQFTWWGG